MIDWVCMYVSLCRLRKTVQTEVACEAGGIVFAFARVSLQKPLFPRLSHFRRAPSPHSPHGFSAPLPKLYRAMTPPATLAKTEALLFLEIRVGSNN